MFPLMHKTRVTKPPALVSDLVAANYTQSNAQDAGIERPRPPIRPAAWTRDGPRDTDMCYRRA
jgi:hypothetical protein